MALYVTDETFSSRPSPSSFISKSPFSDATSSELPDYASTVSSTYPSPSGTSAT
jgi:hypothetical protein